ncbi:MAG: hypothetical protein R3Y22_04685 [Bacteroidales bacterium]
MISVIDHIKYLISKYDCVIIPGWGALIAQYNHGYASDDKVYPPSRVISFNSDINNNDGLLANSLVRREGVTYDIALNLIADEVSSYKIQLNNSGEFTLSEIGLFVKSGSETIVFTPFNDGKIRSDLYGFTAFDMPKLADRLADKSGVDKKKSSNVIYIPISRNIFRVAASIILLIGMSLLLTTPITVNHVQNYASMGVIKSADISNTLVEQNTTKTVVVEQVAEVTPVEIVAVATPEINCVADMKYYLVVGSFNTQDAANIHIKQYKNRVSDLNILYNGNKYMVYAAKGDTFRSLKPIHSEMQQDFKGAWIYRFKGVANN